MLAANPVKKPSSSPLDQALKFLSFRPRSEAEVTGYLKRKRVLSSDITTIVTKLKDLEFLNDAKFCLWWQESRDRSHPISAALLKQELRQKGVATEVMTQVLDASHATELTRAQEALAKKRHVNNPSQFLARRGFSWEVITESLKENA